MEPRRLQQLERASKLRAKVTVLLSGGDMPPEIVELSALRTRHLKGRPCVYVGLLSWISGTRYVELPVVDSPHCRASEEEVAVMIDHALDLFQVRGFG